MLDRLNEAFADAGAEEDATPLGHVEARDNIAAAEVAAEMVAREVGAMDREDHERIIAAGEGRPTVYRPDDPRLLVNAPPLRDERERRQYAAFRSALSVKEHEEARKVRDSAEVRRRNILRRDGVDLGPYLAYCLDAVPAFESFFFQGQTVFLHPAQGA